MDEYILFLFFGKSIFNYWLTMSASLEELKISIFEKQLEETSFTLFHSSSTFQLIVKSVVL